MIELYSHLAFITNIIIMAHISFYHLTAESPEKSACRLLEKCYQNQAKILVRTADIEMQELLNRTLWTFAQKQFIPHCSASDEKHEQHPIYITTTKENPIKANMLMLFNTLDGLYEDFQRIFVLFTKDYEGIKVACQKLNTPSNVINYYKQSHKGAWEQVEL